jgi:hypothetical protein
MARHSDYSPGEDELILSTAGQSAEATIKQLVAAGLPPRTENQIRNRRHYLRRKALTLGNGGSGADKGTELMIKRRRLIAKQEQITTELNLLSREIEDINSQIAHELGLS